MEKTVWKIEGERIMNYKLDEVCKIIDCPHSTAVDEGVGHPLIRTPNVGKGRLILDGVHRVSDEIYEIRTKRGIPENGDLILAREAPIGNVAVIKTNEKVCLGQRTVLLKPDKSKVFPDYLAYYLLTPEQQYKLTGGANGATVAHVNVSTIRDMEVSIPSLEEQQKIASYLSVYDDLIENNQNKIKLLEELQERVYRNEFGLFSFNSDKSVDSMRLMDICNYSRGVSYTSKDLADNGDVSLINLKNIRAYGGYNWGAEKYYAGKISCEQLIMPGSLIMGVTDMTKERRLIGHVAIVPQSLRNAIISMDLIKLLPKIGNGGWLYSLLRYGKLSFLISSYANGVNVLHLRPDTIMDIEVPIPPREQIEQYEGFFWNTERQIEILQSEIDIALDGRNKLLQNIFK